MAGIANDRVVALVRQRKGIVHPQCSTRLVEHAGLEGRCLLVGNCIEALLVFGEILGVIAVGIDWHGYRPNSLTLLRFTRKMGLRWLDDAVLG